MLKLPLKTSFRYVHEPLTAREDAVPLLGNERLVEELVQRLRHSRGGTFLMTGFRGVGKSTVIARALEHLGSAGDEVVVPITLNVARPMTPDQLLFAIVRRLYEALQDRRLLKRLDDGARRALELAHIRTSLGLKQTRSDASEKSGTLNIGLGPAASRLTGPAGWLAPSTALTAKRTRSLALEASYLTYSDSDAEHDLGRIIDLLTRPGPRRWWRRRRPRVRPVVILDELDKLTSEPSGLAEVERLLGHLKNTLTMRGVHFLLAAGPDLHDHAVLDASRGNSVYESIFAWQRYVPCCWDAPDILMRSVLAEETSPTQTEEMIRYLRFKARGIPRRLLQEFGEFVRWENDHPFLVVGEDDKERIAFYAEAEELLDAFFRQDRPDRLFHAEIDDDRWRMAGYFVMDWILRRQGDAFTAVDIAGPKEKPELDPLLRPAEPDVERLLRHLAGRGFLTLVHDPARPDVTLIAGEEPGGGRRAYKLADSVRQRLLGIVRGNADERAALDVLLRLPLQTERDTVARPRPVATRELESVLGVIADRYELVEVIGYGGMSRVYRARDIVARREVAVKIPRLDDPEMLLRVHREVSIVTSLRHPRIVRTLEVIDDEDGTPVIVMELVPGTTLDAVVQQRGPLSAAEVVRLGDEVAEALEYLAARGVSRIDLKPRNIMMTPDRGAVLIDFGSAKRTDLERVTATGMFVGTPTYIAPETISGGETDSRTELYALGVVLYFALTGHSPYPNDDNLERIFYAIMHGEVNTAPLAHVPGLRDVILRAMALNPDDRFSHPTEMRAALQKLRLQEEG